LKIRDLANRLGVHACGRLFCGGLLLTLLALPVFALGYFSALDNKVVQRFVEHFGAGARVQLVYWRQQIEAQRRNEMSDRQRLEFVNQLSNRVPYVDDLSHWGVEEYWATPAEFVASNGGDCDDYAVSKYFALIELGMAPEKLRITYVRSLRAKGIEHHMVLAYYAQPDSEPLILDNLTAEIEPAGHRPDLLPVLSFNDDQAWSGRGGREKKMEVGVIRQWSDLRQRMRSESAP